MTKDEALKLALEALELEDMACRYEKDQTPEHIAKAITAIREALAQPEYNTTSDPCLMENAQGDLERINLVQTGVGIGKPAQQQEPVAWLIWLHGPAGHFDHKQFAEMEFERRNKEYPDPDRKLLPLYTTPPQPESVIDKSAAVRIATALGWEPKRKPLTIVELQKHWQVAKVLDMTDAEISFPDYVLITKDVEALHGIKENK